MKTFTINFKNIGNQSSLRLDFGYRYFFDYKKGVIFDQYQNNTVKLKYVLNLLQSQKVKKGELEQPEKLIDLGNIERRFNNLINVEEVEEIGSDKNILQDGDLIIPKMQPQMGNIFLNLNHEGFIGSTELLEYQVNDNFRPTFLYYLITLKRFLNDLAKLESGKTHRRVNPDDLLKIKIPLIPKPTQDQIVSKIEPIEKEIKELKSQIKDPQEIINQVFAREFGFDENLYKEFGKGMTAGTQIGNDKKLRIFETDFSEFAKSQILRFSTRFHNPPTKRLMEILDNIEIIKVEKIIDSFEKGVQPKYDQNGNIPVVKIANLKNGNIELSDPEYVSNDYYNSLDEKKKLKNDDIIICGTGKISLGKIDLYDLEEKSITTVDNYILRLKENYNKLFFTYFFRSILGYFQIERDFTGATNQIHLYWEQIRNFQIPNIPLPDQQKIVNEIKKELDKQEEIKKQIEEKRNEIDEIVEMVVR